MPATSTLLAGRYRLSGELGRGGMGVVWAAHDELLQRDVAVKEVHFPPSLGADDREKLSGRTLREARAVAAVDTPSAVRVFDIVEQDGRPWIVMELLRGRTLSEELTAVGPLPQAQVARVGLALVDALEAAHAAGILHRDVKPSNVLMVEGGRVALTDFGIATATGDSGDTTTGVVLGSPSYVAPERFQGLPPGTGSDYWALGATLWTAVEGKPPYGGPDAYAVVTAVATAEPPLATRCGPVLRDLLRGVMDRDPARRPGPERIRQVLEQVEREPAAAPTAVLTGPLVADFDRTTVLAAPAPVDVGPAAVAPDPVSTDPPVRSAMSRRPPVRPVAPAALVMSPDGPDPRRHRRRLPLVVAAGLVALFAVTGVLALRGSGGTGPSAAQTPRTVRSVAPSAPSSTVPTAPSSPVTPALVSPSPRPPVASTPVVSTVAGAYKDPSLGWSIAVPTGWTRRVVAAGTRFSDPVTGRYVLIATRYPAGPSAVGAWLDNERSFRTRHGGYQRIRLETITGAPANGARDAADWEFRYREGGALLHTLDRAMVFGKRGYAVYVQDHDDRWNASLPLFQSLEASFHPGG